MDYSIWQWALLGAACVVACGLALVWYSADGLLQAASRHVHQRADRHVFMFHGTDLRKATYGADTFLSGHADIPAWSRLRETLVDRFPGFPASPDQVNPTGRTIVDPTDMSDPWRVRIEPQADLIRVELTARSTSHSVIDPAVRVELDVLRQATQHAPCAMWQTAPDGQVLWQNASSTRLRQMAGFGDDLALSDLFGEKLAVQDSGLPVRHALKTEAGREPAWFDVTCFDQGGTRMNYALDVGTLVRAETAQRNFVQTLSKTFAQLSIGLAIFDRRMQLVLFNPALVDLTGLPADFLTLRPNLLTFFDRLRDARVMPEPKDYGTWRDQLSSMVSAANDGSYLETWSLPTGSTYRVTGRPHPDGAVAFLFEDISSEVSLTRRFRADLELTQGILDEFEDSIAVFSATGVLTLTNRTYRKLWKTDHEASFAEMTVIDAMRIWQDRGGANPFWGEVRDFVLGREGRVTWSSSVRLLDRREYHCSVHPIQNGATLVRMRPANDLASRVTELAS